MKQSYKQLMEQIDGLRAEAAARETEVAGVVGRIKEAIEYYGLTPDQLFDVPSGRKTAGGVNKATKSAAKTKAVKVPRKGAVKQAVPAADAEKADVAPKSAKATKAAKEPKAAKPAKAPKYADSNGNSWSGMGKRPKWLLAGIAAGKSLESFEVGAAATVPAAGEPKPQGAAGTLYGNSEGKTWAGRGPRPKWLKEALEAGQSLESLVVQPA